MTEIARLEKEVERSKKILRRVDTFFSALISILVVVVVAGSVMMIH